LRGGWNGVLGVAPRILLAERDKLLSSQVRSLLKGDEFDLVEASSPPAVASELSKKPISIY
jgi:hypothetical protein